MEKVRINMVRMLKILIVKVPLGTVITDTDTGLIIGDLKHKK